MIEWLIAFGIGLVVSMAIYFIAFYILVIISRLKKAETTVALVRPWMSNIVVGPTVLVLSLLAIYLASAGNLTLWGFQWTSLENTVILSVIGLLIALAVVLSSERLSPTSEKMNPPPDLRGRFLFFMLIVLVASTAEETLFRGFLQGILDNTLLIDFNIGWLSITGGAVVSSILFSLVHIAPAKQMNASVPVLVLSSFILGLVAGIFMTFSGSLLMPIVLHMEFNLIGFILGIRVAV